jgi:hypothetical protein
MLQLIVNGSPNPESDTKWTKRIMYLQIQKWNKTPGNHLDQCIVITTVYNIMSNRTGLEARRKEDQNSPVALLQELFTQQTHHFLAQHSRTFIPQSSLVDTWHHETP